MKKILAIILTILMMTSVFFVTASAADPAAGVVIRITGLKGDGTPYTFENCDHTNFADGWEAAAKLAKNHSWMDVVISSG